MMIWYDIVSLSHVLNYFLKYLLYLVHDFVIFYLSNWLIFSVEYSLHLLSPKQLSLSAENALTTVCQTRWQILSGKEGGLAAAPPYEPTPTPSRLSPLGLDCRPYDHTCLVAGVNPAKTIVVPLSKTCRRFSRVVRKLRVTHSETYSSTHLSSRLRPLHVLAACDWLCSRDCVDRRSDGHIMGCI